MAADSVHSTTKGWMPGATKVAVPASNFSVGNSGRKAAVLHLTEGNAPGVIARFQNPAQRVSSHFLAKRDGAIIQFVSVIDSAYANGASWNPSQQCWVDPQGHLLKPPHAPTWPGMIPPTNPNMTTVSIERELLSTAEPPPAAQNAAVVSILIFLTDTFPTLLSIWHHGTTLIGHCDISPIEKRNCPGPLCDYAGIATAANGPPPPPFTKRYRAKRIYISQPQAGGAPYAGELAPGEEVVVDKWYANGMVHLEDERGFVKLSDLEAV